MNKENILSEKMFETLSDEGSPSRETVVGSPTLKVVKSSSLKETVIDSPKLKVVEGPPSGKAVKTAKVAEGSLSGEAVKTDKVSEGHWVSPSTSQAARRSDEEGPTGSSSS
ncbi:Hypothetical predicted protein [Octopus vulgaris]|uniref:Uncharacterized protein n=1 Tax=Octopus vulgaris TaxID=6645 RepID=A0AA36AUH2_OCTVU|nr:Hypothetical predicted protein [Octopus vulgaris]